MSEYILLGVTVYLWLVGGILLAIACVQGDFKGVPRKNIWSLVLLWPLMTLYATAFVIWGEWQRGSEHGERDE